MVNISGTLPQGKPLSKPRHQPDWVSQSEARSTLVAVAVVAVSISVAAIYFLARYRGTPLQDDFLFTTADVPPTSAPATTYVIGKGGHVFGDFVVTYENVVRRPFDPFVSPVAYGTPYGPPFLVFLKWIFAIGSYKLQLWIFLALSLVAMAVPALWAARKLTWANRLTVIALFGLIPFPTMMALDRGNPQSYVVPALFLAALWIERKRWARAAAMIVVGASIKLYPILLVIPLVIARKFKLAVVTVIASAALTLLALLVFDGSLFDAAQGLVDITRHHSGRQAGVDFANFEFFNWSLAGALVRLGEWIHFTHLVWWVQEAPQVPGLLLLAFIAITLAVSWKILPSWLRSVMYLAPTQLCIPISYPYAMSWVLIPIAFAIRNPSPDAAFPQSAAMPRWIQTFVLAVLAVTASIKPTWGAVSAIVNPGLAAWRNSSQLIDPLLLTAAVIAIGSWGVVEAYRRRSPEAASPVTRPAPTSS